MVKIKTWDISGGDNTQIMHCVAKSHFDYHGQSLPFMKKSQCKSFEKNILIKICFGYSVYM